MHPAPLVESNNIDPGARIWPFVHVMRDVVIGRDCSIRDHRFTETGVRIGDGVVVKNGVSIWSGVMFEDRVFIGHRTWTRDRTWNG